MQTTVHPTAYPDVNALLGSLCAQIQGVLREKLVGIYLYGSLVWGDFEPESSDIDLLAALTSDLNDGDFRALQRMQQDFVAQHVQWDDRIEIAYLSVEGLKTFHTRKSRMGIVSPGEPFHMIEAGSDWLMNWYLVREHGLTLVGPPPQTLIDPMPAAEFVQAVLEHARAWPEYVRKVQTRAAQAYAILTLCRALYTVQTGEHVSKPRAARWVAQAYPQWAELARNALAWRAAWREEQAADHSVTMHETVCFVEFVVGEITAG